MLLLSNWYKSYVTILQWIQQTITQPLRYYIPMIQQDIMLLLSNCYKSYVTILQLIQQATMLLYPIDTTIYSITILLLMQQAITLPHSYRYNNLIWYYTPIDTTIYATAATSYDMIPHYYHEQGDRLSATGGPPPMRTPEAARRTPHQLSKTVNFVLLYCVFFCFAICVIDICLSEDP